MIYHLSTQYISRCTGRLVGAAMEYQAAEVLLDERLASLPVSLLVVPYSVCRSNRAPPGEGLPGPESHSRNIWSSVSPGCTRFVPKVKGLMPGMAEKA